MKACRVHDSHRGVIGVNSILSFISLRSAVSTEVGDLDFKYFRNTCAAHSMGNDIKDLFDG